MAMLARITSFFRWRKADEPPQRSATGSSVVSSSKTRKRSFDKVNHYLENGTIGDESRNSGSETPSGMSPPKRVKLSAGGYKKQEPDYRLQTPRATPPASSAEDKGKAPDRRLMPPPAIPTSKQNRREVAQTPSPRTNSVKAEQDDTKSIKSEQTTASARHRPDGMDVFEAERSRRYADAVKLPANSGIWSITERELFIHLAMRGYEPLLPNNWMRDFKTLPIALFAHQPDDIPLIYPMLETEFRAIKALRDLFETGKLIRDKILSSPGFDIENVLLRRIESYMEWSMTDAGILPTRSTLPVHYIAIRKKGQKSRDTIDELESDLYDLAQRHRDEKGILPSIEEPPSSPVSNLGAPSVQEDDPDALPTLTGLMITYGILVLFTLNPNIKKIKNEQGTNLDDEEMGMRYIARFDFSDSSMDVWNAFSVAIVCMTLRKTQVERGVPTVSPQIAKRRKRLEREWDPDL